MIYRKTLSFDGGAGALVVELGKTAATEHQIIAWGPASGTLTVEYLVDGHWLVAPDVVIDFSAPRGWRGSASVDAWRLTPTGAAGTVNLSLRGWS